MTTLHPIFRTALAPFAPKQSDVHFSEAELQAADTAIARWKGDHHARNDAQAMRLQQVNQRALNAEGWAA